MSSDGNSATSSNSPSHLVLLQSHRQQPRSEAGIDEDNQHRRSPGLRHDSFSDMSTTTLELSTTIRLQAPLMKPRRKKPHAKVKTGCSTCRQRRVKCDEGQPECRQCTKGGRVCPGYQKPKAWLFEPSKQHDLARPFGSASPRLPPSVSPFRDAEGWRSFQYYFEVSEPPMARFFASTMTPLLQFSPDSGDAGTVSTLFWTVTFPRLVCSEAVLARCLSVLVIAHEKLQYSKGTFALEPDCLEKSGEAITLLRREWDNISVDCILLASLLLAVAELSFGPSPSGLSHLYAGSKIIDQRRSCPEHYAHHRNAPKIDGIRETIELFYEAFFAKVDRDLNAMRARNDMLPLQPSISRYWLPLNFTRTQDALGSLDLILTTSQAVMQGNFGEVDPSDRANLRNNAEKWLAGFQDLEAKLNITTDPEFLKACLVIRINGLATLIMASLPTSEFQYSQYKAEFMQIADFALEFMKIGGGMTQSVRAHLIWGTGPVNPIFFTATKCRFPAIRRRLLTALRKLKVVQGLWTSCAAYQIANQMARIEESLTENSLERAENNLGDRIKLESIAFHTTDVITLKFCQQDYAGKAKQYSRKVNIQPCRHQTFLNEGEVEINEFGVIRGFVKPSDCECEEYHSD